MAAFTAAMKSGWKECPEIPHAQTLSMMQMMDFIRRQLGISYEDIQISQIPDMIEGTAAPQPSVVDTVTAAQPQVQDTVSTGEEEAEASVEEAVPAAEPQTPGSQDIPDAEFVEVAAEVPPEKQTE